MAMQSDAHGSEALIKYEYDHLESKQHIRIMTIKPQLGKNDDEEPVRIHLEQFAVSKCPQYQALSYTWGQPQRSDRVLVDDRFYISVTPNLLRALVQLRRKRSVTIWIDAICINQEDIDERSAQVRLMAPIYYGAREVVVWIDPGAPSESGDDAPWVIVQRPEEGESRIVEPPPYALKLFKQSWFTRIWVLQEIVYAQRVTIHFGKREIEWDKAVEWVRDFQGRSPDPRNTSIEFPVEFGMAMTAIMQNWRMSLRPNGMVNIPLSECIESSQYCESTDPKDKIFALLSIARDVSEHFEIDYNWSEAEICRRLTQHTVVQSNRLDILRCIGARRTLRDTHLLPSWVPSLFGESRCSPLPCYNAWQTDAGNQKLAVAALCNSINLVVKCFKLLDVIQISPARMGEDVLTSHGMLTVFQQWYAAVCAHPHYNHRSSEPEDIRYRVNCFWGAMRMTLSVGGIEKHVHDPYPVGEGWHWHFRKIHNKSVGQSQPEDEWHSGLALLVDEFEIFDPYNEDLYSPWAQEVVFTRQGLTYLFERAFGFATAGQIVILPAEAEVGDPICLLYGIQLPFVLRKLENGGYRIVGACYVHQSFDWDTFEKMETLEQMQYIRLQ